MTTSKDDRGQAAVLVLTVAAALFVALSSALFSLGALMLERTRAQTAADAAALGALRGGRIAAAVLVERHGAELLSLERVGAFEVIVVVRLGDSVATAAATDAP